MAQETIDRICRAEEAAQRLQEEAQQAAAAIVARAQSKAQELYDEAVSAALAASQDTLEASREDGEKLIGGELERYREQCRRLREGVAPRREKAVGAVIRELVK